MTKPFNPSRFTDMLDENIYASDSKGETLKGEREELVQWLRKKSQKSQACLHLAEKLDKCRRNHRCKSPACPECASAAQRLIADAARKFLKAHADGETIVCVTVIPDDGMIKPGKLSKAGYALVRSCKERLAKAGVAWFVGAMDISLNEHLQARHKPKWSRHFYGVTVTKNPKKLKRKLRRQFPKNDVIPRPVKVLEWDGDGKALRYIMKPNFSRRIANDHGRRYDKTSEKTTRTCRDTDKQPLKSKQKRELLLHLDDIGIQSRLLMRCCQLSNKKSKGPTILLRLPK